MSWAIDKSKNETEQLRAALSEADAVVVGAGAGLSTSAGFTYAGARFIRYFGDFMDKYHFQDMYSGGFYPYGRPEEMWGFWSRFIYVNRYHNPPKSTYEKVLKLVEDKDYFVITTNVDHCFQKAGIDKTRLFYTQGDYGLWQCRSGNVKKTYDNEEQVKKMLLAQGFWFDHVKSDRGVTVEQDSEMIRQYGEGNAWQCGELDFRADWGELFPPVDPYGSTNFRKLRMSIPSALIPYSPDDGSPMTMNLRSDDTFVEDDGWHEANDRYFAFLNSVKEKKVLFVDLGTGFNTPIIIKVPFMRWTMNWDSALYATINKGEAFAANEIKDKSIVINDDIDAVLTRLLPKIHTKKHC